MRIINKKYSPEAFVKYIVDLNIWRHIDKLVFHHTSSPIETWKGSASMLHYYNLYKSRGWKTGPHIFIAPDGIWLFSPISKQGTHAGPEGNPGSIGIEIVGRYFNEPPMDDTLCKYVALVTMVLQEKFGLTMEDTHHHEEYHPNNNCSPLLTREWVQNNLKKHSDYVLAIMKKYENPA